MEKRVPKIAVKSIFRLGTGRANYGLYIPLVVLRLLMGGLIGLFNGFLLTKREVPPFIPTLGTSIILRGGRLINTKGSGHCHCRIRWRAYFIGVQQYHESARCKSLLSDCTERGHSHTRRFLSQDKIGKEGIP